MEKTHGIGACRSVIPRPIPRPKQRKHAIFPRISISVLAFVWFGHSAHAGEWDDLIESAKKEGQVTVYNGHAGGSEPRVIARAFEQRYGIKVTFLEGRAAEMQERARTEVATGHAIGDVSLNGGNSQTALKLTGSLSLPGDLPNLSKLTVQPTFPEEVPIFVSAAGFAVNTKLVADSERPKRWQDLTDPKWKGKILSDDVTASGIGFTWFSVTLEAFGEDFHKKMAAQNLQFSSTLLENLRRVARGEFAIYFPVSLPDTVALEGLPITGVAPAEGLPYTLFSAAVIRNAPHPNAARLFINFLLEPEAQLAYASTGFHITTKGLEDRAPDKLKWMVNAPLLGRQQTEGQEARRRLSRQIYKRD